MALTGREHFYSKWRDLILEAVSQGPVLDLGTSEPYRKELGVLRGQIPEPYICLDVNFGGNVSIVGDGQHLPFRANTLGAVLCSHVLEHVERPDLVINEIHRVLRPGGKSYLTFLDLHPYHAKINAYPDYHRFKQDSIGLLMRDWSAVTVLPGGGVGQVAVNFLPARFQNTLQIIANRIDRSHPTTVTNVFYVLGTR
jgi:SAM-dependent methyltransferase